MKKKLIWVFLVTALFARIPLAAQEGEGAPGEKGVTGEKTEKSAPDRKSAPEGKNTLSVGITNYGGTFGYERKISPYFSLGIETSESLSFEINTYDSLAWYRGFFGFEGQGKVYPWQGPFFAKIGAGYHWEWLVDKRRGFLLSPGIGWKIDIGEPGAFALVPAIDVPLSFDKIQNGNPADETGIGLVFKITLAYSF